MFNFQKSNPKARGAQRRARGGRVFGRLRRDRETGRASPCRAAARPGPCPGSAASRAAACAKAKQKRRKCASARRRLSAPLRTRWTHAARARLGDQSAPRSWGTFEQVLAKWATSDAGGSEAWGGRGCGDHGPALAGGARRLGSHALLEEGRDLRGARDEAHGINALALLGQDGHT